MHESVARNPCFRQFCHARPPGPVQVIDVILMTETLKSGPVLVGNAEPFGVAGADVDVDGAKVVVLLQKKIRFKLNIFEAISYDRPLKMSDLYFEYD